ncbi:MAG: hypothetical protein DIJKHBIC_01096 [Thermoanaerobaculia bacterium]|nr:hypothetical protein [Thermoanaerobaculia bacterium]
MTVPVALPPPRIEAGATVTEERPEAGVRLRTASAHAPFAVADTTTSVSSATEDVFTVKDPLVWPAGIVTLETDRLAMESETFRSTVVPPVGAGALSVIDPLLAPPERRVEGDTETVIGEAEPVTVTDAVFETVEGNLAVIVDARSVEPETAVRVKVPVS